MRRVLADVRARSAFQKVSSSAPPQWAISPAVHLASIRKGMLQFTCSPIPAGKGSIKVKDSEGCKPCAHKLDDKLKAAIAHRPLRKFSRIAFLRLKRF
jgi:hypothetical protein